MDCNVVIIARDFVHALAALLRCGQVRSGQGWDGDGLRYGWARAEEQGIDTTGVAESNRVAVVYA